MSTQNKTFMMVLLSIGVILVAGLTLANTIYLPIVAKSATPTPTLTLTPTITNTPTATPQTSIQITHIEADPPGPDLESEYVTLKNYNSKSIVMTGWTLQDNAQNTFTFPNNFTLRSGREVKVWSKDGTNTATDLYWDLSSAIWDNLKDCGYLYDKNDDLEDEYCYDRTR